MGWLDDIGADRHGETIPGTTVTEEEAENDIANRSRRSFEAFATRNRDDVVEGTTIPWDDIPATVPTSRQNERGAEMGTPTGRMDRDGPVDFEPGDSDPPLNLSAPNVNPNVNVDTGPLALVVGAAALGYALLQL